MNAFTKRRVLQWDCVGMCKLMIDTRGIKENTGDTSCYSPELFKDTDCSFEQKINRYDANTICIAL